MTQGVYPRKSAEERFERFIEHTETCWLWLGHLSENGYGRFWLNGHGTPAHHFLWSKENGAVPAGLTLDHLCRVRRCVRPEHLEAVTMRENTLRGDTITAANVAKTQCPLGHPYSGDNLIIRKTGQRRCRECSRKDARERARRNARKLNVLAS